MIFIVLSVSVFIQSSQIKNLMYNQQAQFYIYEAQEVATIIKNEPSSDIVNERLRILTQFLDATIITIDKNKNINRVQNPLKNSSPSSMNLSTSFLNQLWKGENIVYTGKVSTEPQEVFLTAIPIKEGNQVNGAVVIYSPIVTLNQHIFGITKIALWGAALGIVLVTIISIFLLKYLTKPLRTMEEAARSIANGEFGKQVPIVTHDEVGRLALSLNHMSVQLREKIDAIQRLDKIRQEFVSNVSHELRTPLTVIQSFSEAILDGLVKTEEEKKQYLNSILDESKRLKRLVDDLLDLRSLEFGQVMGELEMEYILVSKLIHVTSGNFSSLAKEKNIELTVVPFPQEVKVLGNIDRLKQVMTNLIGNAITYTPEGGKIEVTWGVTNEKKAIIRVTDNGPGIPTEELENIWERFYKVDKSRSRKTQGTGLGLAIAKKIVELHGGDITVESTLGQGSTFNVELPVIE